MASNMDADVFLRGWMDRLAAMRTFIYVVEERSFSGAAKRIGLANATVTASIKNLEKHLGAPLLNRTTRHVSATNEGKRYFERARAILAEIDEMEDAVSSAQRSARGHLMVEVPAALGRAFIVPHLRRFTEQNPEIQVTLLLNPDPGGLVQSGIDVGLQLGALKDSNYIAKKVINTRHVVCASPEYLKRMGRPGHPSDLGAHNCLGFYNPRSGRVVDWSFRKESETIRHVPQGSMHFNSSQALLDVAIAGGGVIYTLDILVKDLLASKLLVPLLPDWTTLQRPLFLIYPPHKYQPQKTKVFSAFVQGLWTRKP
jgi:LysR family transcriptional regulator for bpeEF and oprC